MVDDSGEHVVQSTVVILHLGENTSGLANRQLADETMKESLEWVSRPGFDASRVDDRKVPEACERAVDVG